MHRAGAGSCEGVVDRAGNRSGFRTVSGAAPSYPHLLALFQHYEGNVRAELGERVLDACLAKGVAMTVDDAVDYALSSTKEPEAGPAAAQPARLTRRETEVAKLVGEGLTNKEIAARLVVSQRTAEAHVEHVLTKLDFRSRAQIAVWIGSVEADK